MNQQLVQASYACLYKAEEVSQPVVKAAYITLAFALMAKAKEE